MKTKGILFNTEAVRAILDGRKNMMRRVVKPQPKEVYHGGTIWDYNGCPIILVEMKNGFYDQINVPYKRGDILYVRETWEKAFGVYWYRADEDNPSEPGQIPGMIERTKWHPSIHMPKEAARIFLRVTDVWVERLQGITMTDMKREGVVPESVTGGQWQQWGQEYMRPAWNSTVKKADLPRYGWDANPWVWAISFERISKEEATQDGT